MPRNHGLNWRFVHKIVSFLDHNNFQDHTENRKTNLLKIILVSLQELRRVVSLSHSLPLLSKMMQGATLTKEKS